MRVSACGAQFNEIYDPAAIDFFFIKTQAAYFPFSRLRRLGNYSQDLRIENEVRFSMSSGRIFLSNSVYYSFITSLRYHEIQGILIVNKQSLLTTLYKQMKRLVRILKSPDDARRVQAAGAEEPTIRTIICIRTIPCLTRRSSSRLPIYTCFKRFVGGDFGAPAT